MSYLLIQTSAREHTPRPAAVPIIVGPFSTEEDAEQYATDHGMGQGHDEYGGCLSVCVVWNDLTVHAPAEFAETLDWEAN